MLLVGAVTCLMLTSALCQMLEVSGQFNSQPCDLCKTAVNYLDVLLQRNNTLDELETVIRKFCNTLPDGVQQKCKKSVQQYSSLISKFLLHELEPDQVCTALGLCFTDKQVLDLESYAMSTVDSEILEDECSVCESVLPELVKSMKDQLTVDAVEEALNQSCQLLFPTFRDECQTMVNMYTAFVLEILVQKLESNNVCMQFGFCKAFKTERMQENGAPFCIICTFIMQQLDSILGNNSTEPQIEAALKRVCGFLPEFLRAECSDLVSQYTPEIIQLLLHYPPDKVCSFLRLCSAEGATGEVVSKEVQSPTTQSLKCSLCTKFIDKVKSQLGKNSTQAQIITILEKACNIFPSSARPKCKKYVDQYAPMLIQLLLSGLSSKQICEKIGLCKAHVENVEVSVNEAQSSVSNDIQCTLCKKVIDKVKSQIGKQSTKDQIKKVLGKVCKLFPSSFRSQCQKFIDKYTPRLIDLLLSGLSSKDICSQIGLCNADMQDAAKLESLIFVSENKEEPITPAVPDYCNLCKLASYEVPSTLDHPLWLNTSKETLYELCSYLEDGQDSCRQLVDDILNDVSTEISNSKFTTNFCSLCVTPAPIIEDEATCTICKMFAEIIDFNAEQKKTVTEIEEILTEACSIIIPDVNKPQCLLLVMKYTTVLVELQSQHNYPIAVCQAVKLCTRHSQGTLLKVLTSGGN